MTLKTMAIAKRFLSSDHVGTPIDTNTTVTQQQRNCVFIHVHAEMLHARQCTVEQVRQWSGMSLLLSE
jgi:hypothetical protein